MIYLAVILGALVVVLAAVALGSPRRAAAAAVVNDHGRCMHLSPDLTPDCTNGWVKDDHGWRTCADHTLPKVHVRLGDVPVWKARA